MLMNDRSTLVLRQITAQPISPTGFAPYGQVMGPTEDGKPFDQADAQLVLDQGIPRFYIMRLAQRPLRFTRITQHKRCTQCLGSVQGQPWYLAVAPPSDPIDLDQLQVFKISGICFVKLDLGTWHAGPYFDHTDWMDFYNLELSDTNLTDHTTYDLGEILGLEFAIVG